jgi:hypothetical protein
MLYLGGQEDREDGGDREIGRTGGQGGQEEREDG